MQTRRDRSVRLPRGVATTKRLRLGLNIPRRSSSLALETYFVAVCSSPQSPLFCLVSLWSTYPRAPGTLSWGFGNFSVSLCLSVSVSVCVLLGALSLEKCRELRGDWLAGWGGADIFFIMALAFAVPEVAENLNGWGPAADSVPSQLEHVPYAPFSKSDRVGRASDWTGQAFKYNSGKNLHPILLSFSLCLLFPSPLQNLWKNHTVEILLQEQQ